MSKIIEVIDFSCISESRKIKKQLLNMIECCKNFYNNIFTEI